MRHHVFADETGCLTFKRKPHVSKYFILCSIATKTPNIGMPILDLRRELSWTEECHDAFHATTDSQPVRDKVFALIANMDFRIDATILEKSKALPRIRQTDEQFYKYAWHFHFKYIAPQILSANDELHLTAASLGTKKQKAIFKDVLNDVVRQTLGNVEYKIAFWPASSDPCLQIADYCAWAIQRKWERGDHRSYKIIEDKIHTEYDLFSKGTTNHY